MTDLPPVDHYLRQLEAASTYTGPIAEDMLPLRYASQVVTECYNRLNERIEMLEAIVYRRGGRF